MTERPILFNGDMIRAIADGLKFQTRRPMDPQPEYMLDPIPCEWYTPTIIRGGEEMPGKDIYGTYNDDQGWKSPFGAPGDLLIPLTTWAVHREYNGVKPTELPDAAWVMSAWGGYLWEKWIDPDSVHSGKLRPGRFMPKKFRHLLPRLLVKRVWVERVQSITDADVVAEGIEQINIDKYRKFFDPRDVHGIAFGELWDSIYADKYPWAGNPFVWCCEFEVTDKRA